MIYRGLQGLCVAGLMLISGCHEQPKVSPTQTAQKTSPQHRSEYFGDHTDHKHQNVVIFVHGLFGDQNSFGKEQSFQRLLAEDPSFKDEIDVFTFQYESSLLGKSPRITDLVSELRGDLEDAGVTDHDHLIFLSHSMGGLITRQYLLSTPSIVPKVSLLAFYGTPTNGAKLAKKAKIISSDPQLHALLPMRKNDYLAGMNDEWRGNENVKRIPATCMYEMDKMYGQFIVEETSAQASCEAQALGVPGNHVEIVKPTDRNDRRYTRFATALRRAIGHLPVIQGTRYEYTFQTGSGTSETTCIGAFRQVGTLSWEEVTLTPAPCPPQAFQFRQLDFGSDGILLFDENRDVFIRLPNGKDGGALYRQGSHGTWDTIHRVVFKVN